MNSGRTPRVFTAAELQRLRVAVESGDLTLAALESTASRSGGDMTHPSDKLPNIRRRVMRARIAAPWMDPCSRHLHIMADALSMGRKVYPMLQEEPEHCAVSMYYVLEMLWKTRAELAKREKAAA